MGTGKNQGLLYPLPKNYQDWTMPLKKKTAIPPPTNAVTFREWLFTGHLLQLNLALIKQTKAEVRQETTSIICHLDAPRLKELLRKSHYLSQVQQYLKRVRHAQTCRSAFPIRLLFKVPKQTRGQLRTAPRRLSTR